MCTGPLLFVVVDMAVAAAKLVEPYYTDLAPSKAPTKGAAGRAGASASIAASARSGRGAGAGSVAGSLAAGSLAGGTISAAEGEGHALQWGQLKAAWLPAVTLLKELLKALLASATALSSAAATAAALGHTSGSAAAAAVGAPAEAPLQPAAAHALVQVASAMRGLFLAVRHAEVAARILDEWEGGLSLCVCYCSSKAAAAARCGAPGAAAAAPVQELEGLWVALLKHVAELAAGGSARAVQGWVAVGVLLMVGRSSMLA